MQVVKLACEDCGCEGGRVESFQVQMQEEDGDDNIFFYAECPYCHHGKTVSLRTVVNLALEVRYGRASQDI